MNAQHPIRKKRGPLPHDPRNEPLPESGRPGRSKEGEQKEVHPEEGLGMKATTELRRNTVVVEDEYGLPTGIPTGQTTRGSNPTDRIDPKL